MDEAGHALVDPATPNRSPSASWWVTTRTTSAISCVSPQWSSAGRTVVRSWPTGPRRSPPRAATCPISPSWTSRCPVPPGCRSAGPARRSGHGRSAHPAALGGRLARRHRPAVSPRGGCPHLPKPFGVAALVQQIRALTTASRQRPSPRVPWAPPAAPSAPQLTSTAVLGRFAPRRRLFGAGPGIAARTLLPLDGDVRRDGRRAATRAPSRRSTMLFLTPVPVLIHEAARRLAPGRHPSRVWRPSGARWPGRYGPGRRADVATRMLAACAQTMTSVIDAVTEQSIIGTDRDGVIRVRNSCAEKCPTTSTPSGSARSCISTCPRSSPRSPRTSGSTPGTWPRGARRPGAGRRAGLDLPGRGR